MDRHRHVAADVCAEVLGLSGSPAFCAHIASLMQEKGVKVIYTRDADCNRLPLLEAIDPVTEHRRTKA